MISYVIFGWDLKWIQTFQYQGLQSFEYVAKKSLFQFIFNLELFENAQKMQVTKNNSIGFQIHKKFSKILQYLKDVTCQMKQPQNHVGFLFLQKYDIIVL